MSNKRAKATRENTFVHGSQTGYASYIDLPRVCAVLMLTAAPPPMSEAKGCLNRLSSHVSRKTGYGEGSRVKPKGNCTLRVAPLLVALGLLPVASESARAASYYDPELTWATISTPRFAVHYHDGARNLAVRVGRIAEEVMDDVSDVFGYMPEGRIELVLTDKSDRANGSAQIMPKNIIRLYLTAPTELTGLSSYDDWLRLLLIHELAHICDLDQTWWLTRLGRWIFGKFVALNGYTPQFLSEGVAVYTETLLTKTGRGRSSYVSMLVRTAALEGKFLKIDQAHVKFSDWPGPNAAYFYGGRFHLWLSTQFGQEAVRDLHQFYAAQPIPYFYWFGAKSIFGSSLPDLWDQWRAAETRFALDIKAEVERHGVTPSRAITTHGRNITGALYSPDSTFIIYSRTSPVDGSTVRRIQPDGSGDRHLVLETFSPRFSFAPNGGSFYYSQNAINERFNDYNDLYRYDLETDEVTKLKDAAAPESSLRARDPGVSSDGKRLVFVQNGLHQNWVSIGDIVGEERDLLHVRVLIQPQGDTQHAGPRFSPDGRLVVVSTWFGGGYRDIVLVDAQTGELQTRVTYDTAEDGNPSWSPDGRFVLWESDLDGISNIYAYELASQRYFRVTRVVGGAFQPSVSADGKFLLFRNTSGRGFDIHEMPYEPEQWEAKEYLPGHSYLAQTDDVDAVAGPEYSSDLWPESKWGRGLPRAQEPPMPLLASEEEGPYSPWSTLLPFQDNWLLIPGMYLRNNEPSALVTTLGQDVLGQHTYGASVGSGLHVRRLNWSAFYVNDMWYPTVAASYADMTTSFPFSTARAKQRRRSATVGISLPVAQRHSAALTYSFERRTALNTVARRTLALGDFARAEAAYRYSFSRHFPYSVGSEHGRTVAAALRWYSKSLGAEFNELMLTTDARWYINNPLFDNQVLALRLAAAFALGPDYRELFSLGGAQGASVLSSQTEQVFPLRGFRLNLKRYPQGTGVLAVYSEYRLPLWHIERGLWTLPIYFERVHMALFAEGGNTFGDGSEKKLRAVANQAYRRMRRGRLGCGVEMRLSMSLGWLLPLTLRFGVGWPLIERGRPAVYDPIRQALVFLAFGNAI